MQLGRYGKSRLREFCFSYFGWLRQFFVVCYVLWSFHVDLMLFCIQVRHGWLAFPTKLRQVSRIGRAVHTIHFYTIALILLWKAKQFGNSPCSLLQGWKKIIWSILMNRTLLNDFVKWTVVTRPVALRLATYSGLFWIISQKHMISWQLSLRPKRWPPFKWMVSFRPGNPLKIEPCAL